LKESQSSDCGSVNENKNETLTVKNDIIEHSADDFTEILSIIEQARENAHRAVNRE